MAGKMRLIGVEAVEEMLSRLPEANAKKVVQTSLRAGASVIRKQAKANLTANGSVDTGALRNTLTIYKKAEVGKFGSMTVALRASGKLYMVVRGGDGKPTRARPSKYAHFVEYGTEHSRAEPFFRPAVETKRDEAVQAIIEGAAKGLVREATKLGAKARLG
jgi:HK97 gp10 family phage protein